MATMLEQMMAEREARGEARGRAEGRAEVLIRLLRRRFGDIPAELEAQVRAASATDLDVWIDSCFDAPDLESVVKSGRMN